MDDRIITIYCLCDECLKALHHRDDPQCAISDAEVITTALVAAVFFRGNLEAARVYLQAEHWIPNMLSRSRLNRRLHRIRELLLTLVGILGETWKTLNTEAIYSIDSFPIPVCDNYRIPHAKRYQDVEELLSAGIDVHQASGVALADERVAAGQALAGERFSPLRVECQHISEHVFTRQRPG